MGSLMDIVREHLKKQKELPQREEHEQVKEPAQATDFQAEATRIKAALYKRGLVKIRSETLGGEVWWARSDKEASQAPPSAVVYTLDELRELARGNPTREGLRQVHEAKKIFGGTVQTGTFSWDEIGQKEKAGQENRPPDEEDPYLKLFQETLAELNKLLDGQNGLAPWLEKYRPGLADRIARYEEKLNELWGWDLENFKAELQRFYALNERAIRLYKQSPEYAKKEARRQ